MAAGACIAYAELSIIDKVDPFAGDSSNNRDRDIPLNQAFIWGMSASRPRSLRPACYRRQSLTPKDKTMPLRLRPLAALAAGLTATSAAADPLASLAGSEWGFPDAGDAFIQFRETDVSGSTGCNRFFGTYSFVDGALTFGPVVTTPMACPPDKMDTERKVLALLEAVKTAGATHKNLVLKDASGATLATLPRRDWD